MSGVKFLLALLLAWAVAAQAAELAPEALAGIGQQLDQAPVLRGEFEQNKTIKGFKKPLLSRGSFVIARGKGVQWLTAQPFASTLVITPDRLVTINEAGGGQKMDAKQEPGLRAFNETLLGLLGGDVKLLATRFKTEGSAPPGGPWKLSLTPRDAALAALIARIEIEGDQHVRAILLQEASGDLTRIRFSRHQAGSLSAAETGRFAP